MIIRSADFAKFEVPPLGRESLGSNFNMEIVAEIKLSIRAFLDVGSAQGGNGGHAGLGLDGIGADHYSPH